MLSQREEAHQQAQGHPIEPARARERVSIRVSGRAGRRVGRHHRSQRSPGRDRIAGRQTGRQAVPPPPRGRRVEAAWLWVSSRAGRRIGRQAEVAGSRPRVVHPPSRSSLASSPSPSADHVTSDGSVALSVVSSLSAHADRNTSDLRCEVGTAAPGRGWEAVCVRRASPARLCECVGEGAAACAGGANAPRRRAAVSLHLRLRVDLIIHVHVARHVSSGTAVTIG
jgi:hypothetical protein